MTYEQLPEVLRRFDRKPSAIVAEAIPTQVLWICLLYLPSLGGRLGLIGVNEWRLGGHGMGDISGRDADDKIVAHIELKSATAKANVGSRCFDGCGQELYQLEHMAHRPYAQIALVTHTARFHVAQKMAQRAGLGERVQIKSFAEVADAIDLSLAQDGTPRDDLLESLFDVETAPPS
ncbi:hypothetical protein [Micromonospora sp. WMMD980]|uniref:hypothetical protein n=1 Tax=Micromonospora sp. WMMD980 TaxID=3016088 RepID=UPI0024164116|nr:hypothetical protein [Micromonospora sp. WMMD980]MDG4803711.1 hypothetical protein [Micromonospora sp. WMMD980]